MQGIYSTISIISYSYDEGGVINIFIVYFKFINYYWIKMGLLCVNKVFLKIIKMKGESHESEKHIIYQFF